MSPAMYCSGVKLVVWWRWIVDMRGSCLSSRTYSTNGIKSRNSRDRQVEGPGMTIVVGIMMSIISAL